MRTWYQKPSIMKLTKTDPEGDGIREKMGATRDPIAAPLALYPCCIASKSQFGRLDGHCDRPADRSQ